MTCTRPNCTCTGNIPVHPITKAGRDWRGLLFFAVVIGLAVFL